MDDLLGILPYFKFRGRKSVHKYGFLFEFLTKSGDDINVIIDHTVCSFLPHNIFEKFPFILRVLFCELDFILWTIFNKGHKIKRISRLDSGHKDSVAIAFLWRNLESSELGDRSIETLSQFHKVVLHCTHYFLNARNKGLVAANLTNRVFAGDNDFRHNVFFKKIFDFQNEEFLILPFAVEDRFKNIARYEERLPKCIGTGSIIEISSEMNQSRHKDVTDFFKINTYHIGRKILNSKKGKLKKFFILQSKMREEKTSNNFIKHLFSLFDIRQSSYYDIDIAEQYNTFKYAYVGEEITGATALGNFEAMACGCVVFGKEGFFCGLGLKPNVDFLQINGEFEDFVSDFEIGQFNGVPLSEINLESISHNGIDFIERNFRRDEMFLKWKDNLNSIARQGEYEN